MSNPFLVSECQNFKETIRASTFCWAWKEAVLCPIHEKWKKNKIWELETLLITMHTIDSFSKVLVKRPFMYNEHYLHKAQFGFRLS